MTGESVYGEKKISVDGEAGGEKIEYRVWNPFRSKLAAAILGGVDNIHMKPGSKVLYLGAASGTTVSHVSDIVGPVCIFIQCNYNFHYMTNVSYTVDNEKGFLFKPLLQVILLSQDGLVYAVEFSHRSGRDLINVAKKRTNVIPIIEDARHPHKYRMLVGM